MGSEGSTCRFMGGCCLYADTPVDGQCSCGTFRSDATAHRIPCKVTLDEDDAEEEDVTPPRVSQQAKPDTSPPTATPTSSETLDNNDDLTPSPTQQSEPDTSPPTATPTASPTLSSIIRPTIHPTAAPTLQPTVDAPELQALCRLKNAVNTLNVRIDDLSDNPRYKVFDFDEV